MAERADELRQELGRRRAGISHTVDEIENRVRPGRVLSRRSYHMRRRVVDWRDRIFGNDELEYPDAWGYGLDPRSPYAGAIETDSGGSGGAGETLHRAGDRASGMAHDVSERASHLAHDIGDQARHAPEMVRHRTQGAPIGAGLIALGAGLLVASMLPPTRREQDLARDAEPQLRRAVDGAKSSASDVAADIADDLREPAQEAVDEVRRTATEEGQEFKGEASEEAHRTRDDVGAAVRDR